MSKITSSSFNMQSETLPARLKIDVDESASPFRTKVRQESLTKVDRAEGIGRMTVNSHVSDFA